MPLYRSSLRGGRNIMLRVQPIILFETSFQPTLITDTIFYTFSDTISDTISEAKSTILTSSSFYHHRRQERYLQILIQRFFLQKEQQEQSYEYS